MLEYVLLRARQALLGLLGLSRVSVTCHPAYLEPGPDTEPEVTRPPQEGVPFAPVATIAPKKPKLVLCITVANVGRYPSAVTNVYLGGPGEILPAQAVLNPSRPLPVYLGPGAVWETWAELPRGTWARYVRSLTRTVRVVAIGRTYAARRRRVLPPAGNVPG